MSSSLIRPLTAKGFRVDLYVPSRRSLTWSLVVPPVQERGPGSSGRRHRHRTTLCCFRVKQSLKAISRNVTKIVGVEEESGSENVAMPRCREYPQPAAISHVQRSSRFVTLRVFEFDTMDRPYLLVGSNHRARR